MKKERYEDSPLGEYGLNLGDLLLYSWDMEVFYLEVPRLLALGR